MSNMKMIEGEMTFTPGTTKEEMDIHMEISASKWKIAAWMENGSPMAKANAACERFRVKELKAQLKNFKKII